MEISIQSVFISIIVSHCRHITLIVQLQLCTNFSMQMLCYMCMLLDQEHCTTIFTGTTARLIPNILYNVN